MKTLKLEPGAFNQELLPIIGTNKVGWNGENHSALVDALIPRLLDADGNAVTLGDKQKSILDLLFHPTIELQHKVLDETFQAAGYELDESTKAAFALLFNVVQFGEYLQKKENPKTKKPFVSKPPSRVKKKTFDALLAEEPTSEDPQSDSPVAELGEADNDQGPTTAASTVLPPVPNATKPTVNKR